jgi:tRNA(Ile)-lysidine synthase
MKDSLLNKVLSTISRFRMLQKGDSVLISVSGGPDSVFLADALNQIKAFYGLKLYCFHLDHKTRNGQSSKDAAFVRNFCGNIGLKLFSEERDVKEWCRQSRLSFQDGARRLRLDLLNETAEKNSIKKISTGHTADDNAETFLMHLLRGSGLRGLSGIQPVNGLFIRPLLEIFHSDILDYLAENRIPYCSDKTNLENIYSRNKIRNVLIPFINNNFTKNFVKNLSGTIDVIRQENAFIDDYGRKCLKSIAEIGLGATAAAPGKTASISRKTAGRFGKANSMAGEPGVKGKSSYENKGTYAANQQFLPEESIKIPLIKLRAYPESVIKRIMISAIELINGDSVDIRRENLADITRLCFSGNERKELLFAGGITVIREGEYLYLSNAPTKSTDRTAPVVDIEIEIGFKQELEIANVKYLVEAFFGGSDFLKDKNIKSSEAYLDFEKIRFPVKVDYWHKTGERFVPLGLKDFKKIQDYFTDMKIPYGKRLHIPLFYDQEKIIWVGNYRIDERAKIDEQTKKIFHVKIIDI